jgi:hypothetical protein
VPTCSTAAEHTDSLCAALRIDTLIYSKNK